MKMPLIKVYAKSTSANHSRETGQIVRSKFRLGVNKVNCSTKAVKGIYSTTNSLIVLLTAVKGGNWERVANKSTPDFKKSNNARVYVEEGVIFVYTPTGTQNLFVPDMFRDTFPCPVGCHLGLLYRSKKRMSNFTQRPTPLCITFLRRAKTPKPYVLPCL